MIMESYCLHYNTVTPLLNIKRWQKKEFLGRTQAVRDFFFGRNARISQEETAMGT